jgi:cephalosporin hydroxylase
MIARGGGFEETHALHAPPARVRSRIATVMSDSLHELGVRHGTDKAGSNRGGQRQLLWHYERLLVHRQHDPIVLVEIGVKSGASLRMWHDYFPSGQIFGIDINPESAEHSNERISVRIGSQSDTAFLDALLAESGPPDVVVDDGSHRVRDQIATLTHLWPQLNPGGLYIVEDIHTSYMPEYNMRWREPGTAVEFLKGVADDVHERWHDRPVMLHDCATITFVQEACLMTKRA